MSLPSQNGDGYGLLTAAGVNVRRPPTEGGLFFVDMDLRSDGWDRVVAALRGLPPSAAGDASQIVFRSPIMRGDRDSERNNGGWPGWPEDIGDLATSLAEAISSHRLPRVEVGAFALPLAAAPTVSPALDATTLVRCRAVELETFLARGNAIWRPREYHYRLPSGHHAASFVRIADAFRDHRAPAALSSWLHGCITADTVIVVDSGTLMPIVQQLDATMRSASLTGTAPRVGLADIQALDAYPRTRYEYLRRFESLGELDVLALLSVSSTGRTYNMLKDTLQETVHPERWRSECLVSRTGEAATVLPPPDARGRQAPWYSLGDKSRDWRSASRCELCQNPATARLVQVDPLSFAAMVLPDPKRIMPHTATGRRNESLWTCYMDRRDSIDEVVGVQLVASETTTQRSSTHLRSSGVEQVQFDATLLLMSLPDDSIDPITRQVIAIQDLLNSRQQPSRVSKTLTSLHEGEPTLAVCDADDLNVLGGILRDVDKATSRLLQAVQVVCPTIECLIDVGRLSSDDLGGLTSTLLVVAGLRTGVTLQRLMVSVQDHYRTREDEPSMHGLVLHAHPPDSRAWRSVQNTFRGSDGNTRLLALWLTYLPDRSPLSEEFELLEKAQGEWFVTASVRELWERRREWLRPDSPGQHESFESPFWSPTRVELRRTSLYGSLDDRHTLVAVGTAMQEALEQNTSERTPEWVQFDLPNALRSYFDGLIHAAIIRWLTPERAWWGQDDNACVALLSELEGRFEGDWKLLLPELLLAAAHGKIPDSGVRHLIARAESRLSADASEQWPRELLDYVELGLMLVRKLVSFTAEGPPS